MDGAGILAWLNRALGASPAHGKLHAASLTEATELARRLPYVHRTADPRSSRDWRGIFRGDSVGVGESQTPWEHAAGHPEAVYLFLGAGAYPHGKVALLFRSLPGPASFAAIDTGGLYRERMVDAGGQRIPRNKGIRLFTELYADANDIVPFASGWIAAHFADSRDYVRRGMVSAPDVSPPLHGAESEDGHRLAWTIEVQHHDAVPLPAHLARIVCARRDDVLSLPPRYLRLARSVGGNDLDDDGFFALISDTILSYVEAPR